MLDCNNCPSQRCFLDATITESGGAAVTSFAPVGEEITACDNKIGFWFNGEECVQCPIGCKTCPNGECESCLPSFHESDHECICNGKLKEIDDIGHYRYKCESACSTSNCDKCFESLGEEWCLNCFGGSGFFNPFLG